MKSDTGVELRFDLWWVWETWCALNNQRQYGNGPNPISFSDLHSYVKLKGIYSDEDRDFLLKVIPRMDNKWLDDFAQKQQAKRKEADRKSSKKK